MLHTLALLLPTLVPQAPGIPVDSLWGDWNSDAREDLLLVESGGLRLFEDDGGAGLREVTSVAGLEGWSGLTSVLWEDLDGDGRADLLLGRADGDGALLVGLEGGGWIPDPSGAGLDLARPLSRVTRTGTSLLLDGPDGRRVARFEAGRGWRELALERPAVVTRWTTDAERASDVPSDAPSRRADAPSRRAALAASVGVGGATSAASLPPLNGICAGFVEDQATSTCLPASSLPILGSLYPLSVDWNVTPTGSVGVGTTTPAAKLDVVGSVRAQQLVSTAGALTAPLVVASSVKVANLNADKLDGIDSTAFSQLGSSIEGDEIALGTITADRLASPLTGNGIAGPTLYATASGLGASALRGVGTGGSSHVGVFGESTAASGLSYGVRGVNASTGGRAVSGEATALTGANVGVYASTSSSSGVAVQAVASSTSGSTAAVRATNASGAGIAVHGVGTRTGNFETFGVLGEVVSQEGAGLMGKVSNAAEILAPLHGVYGLNVGTYGTGVHGSMTKLVNSGHGVLGKNVSDNGWAVYAWGDQGASGVKSFVQPHPSDPSREIRFVCLEGNESGTYFRGSGTLVDGAAVIEVPEEFRLVSEREGLTVQVTARGPGSVWVESEDLERIVVRGSAHGFHYLVNGVRRGFAKVELVRPNHQWVPELRGVPYGPQFPEALRRILVENGTLNPDFTPNEETAAAQGWVLRDAESEWARGSIASQGHASAVTE